MNSLWNANCLSWKVYICHFQLWHGPLALFSVFYQFLYLFRPGFSLAVHLLSLIPFLAFFWARSPFCSRASTFRIAIFVYPSISFRFTVFLIFILLSSLPLRNQYSSGNYHEDSVIRTASEQSLWWFLPWQQSVWQ